MDELIGRVAVVTGAASGIGLAIARALTEQGMTVVCADIDAPEHQRATDSLTGRVGPAVGVVTDVADPRSVAPLRDETVTRFRTAHVVCNIAGVPSFQNMTKSVDLESWRRNLDINLFGVIHGVEAFLPRLVHQDEGHIVNSRRDRGSSGARAPVRTRQLSSRSSVSARCWMLSCARSDRT